MQYIYSALFTPIEDGSGYYARVPDLPRCITTSSSLLISLLSIDTIAYRSKTDTKSVRKNVSLPAWTASMADKRGINCSQLLQDSLLSKLNA
jgi:hypothetical protein